MSLQFALLGFLATTPASGYTLGRKFADGAGAMWEALPSQIYPELRKLEKLGWITGKLDSSNKLGRRIYEVTPDGLAALQAWVEGNESQFPPERDAERVRFLFLDRSELPVIRSHVERHRSHYLERRRKWDAERNAIANGTSERNIDRMKCCPPEEQTFVTSMKWFAFDGLVRHADMEIQWADNILDWLNGVTDRQCVSAPPYAVEAEAAPQYHSNPPSSTLPASDGATCGKQRGNGERTVKHDAALHKRAVDEGR